MMTQENLDIDFSPIGHHLFHKISCPLLQVAVNSYPNIEALKYKEVDEALKEIMDWLHVF